MKMRKLFLFSVALFAPLIHVLADVPGTKISVVGSNAIVSWPSRTGETFVVQYRAALHTNTPWTTLAAHRIAALNTNWTSFTHTNAVLYPAPCPGSTNGTAEGPPAPGGASMTSSGATREPYTWERENRPPFPWDPEFTEGSSYSLAASSMEASASSSESGCEPPTLGFYRVFKTSPTANLDYFSVEQNTQTNQLGIFDNDFDPDNSVFLLSNVTSPNNGTIDYTDTASIFHYTPTAGFFGSNSFTYTITNLIGGMATARGSVFVNQSGNNAPTIAAPLITLATNVYTSTINPTNGATDPDGDAISFVAFTSPQLGTVVNNAGQLVYTHPTNLFGRDWFDYFLTDGRGGLTKVRVLILQADGDNDGMADEWELRFGLDPALDDSYGDTDTDGLPNLAEYKLSTHPSIADNPLSLDKVAVGQAITSDSRIPLSLNASILKPDISLMMNSNRADGALQQAADGTWYFSWDTGYLTNGNYLVGLEFLFNPNAQPPTASTLFGATKTVRVTNEVIFDQLNSEFTHTLFLNLTFPYQNAEWRIEFYDEDGSGLVYFDGTTTDGNVQGSWDLTDTGQGGQQISFGNVLTEVYVAPLAAGQGGGGGALPPPGSRNPNARRWFAKQIPGGIGNAFVVAWGWDSYGSTFNQRREELMMDGVINIIGNPGLDDEYTLRPGSNIPFGGAFRYDDEFDKKVLMDAMKSGDAGNFFWFGHAGGGSAITGNPTKSRIDVIEVQDALGNIKHRSKPPKRSYQNKHPYRLVILNSCQSYDAGWAHAFGMDYNPLGTTNDVLAYYQQGRQSQAFVGWDENIEVPTAADATGVGHSRYATALAYLFSAWMDGSLLEEGLRQYSDYLDVLGYQGHKSWKISGTASFYRGAP